MNQDDKSLDAQFDHLLNQLEVEKAPSSLTRRLKRIPRDHREKKPFLPWLFPGPLPKWVMAPAFAAVRVASINSGTSRSAPLMHPPSACMMFPSAQ